jgi:hypothetical protein
VPGRSTLNMAPRIAEVSRGSKGKIFDKAHWGE